MTSVKHIPSKSLRGKGVTDFVMDGFYRDSLAEFAQTNEGVVKLAQSFRTECEIQDSHFKLSDTPTL
jgi:hypothetical protein